MSVYPKFKFRRKISTIRCWNCHGYFVYAPEWVYEFSACPRNYRTWSDRFVNPRTGNTCRSWTLKPSAVPLCDECLRKVKNERPDILGERHRYMYWRAELLRYGRWCEERRRQRESYEPN